MTTAFPVSFLKGPAFYLSVFASSRIEAEAAMASAGVALHRENPYHDVGI
jgi:hypothetical protein